MPQLGAVAGSHDSDDCFVVVMVDSCNVIAQQMLQAPVHRDPHITCLDCYQDARG